ncbi:uncharacterized protein LOC131855252 [Achroia grisella]|uniref:uncharacterized protein LOC131855252 n=1 Tax=Achroia grisella TaxID=688607 RepID=UPI0027D34226|nr:uncharacterized protein LOC131855252 [Achroia grisella]
MDTVMAKGKPLSKDETKALLQLIENSRIITTKCTNTTNNKLKIEEWTKITEQFNATATTCRRTPQQLRLKWENLKKNSRKRATKIRMNNIQTGGGAPDYIPPDDILDRVASVLGSTVSGFTVPFGGDKEDIGDGICVGDGVGGGVGDGVSGGVGDGIVGASDSEGRDMLILPDEIVTVVSLSEDIAVSGAPVMLPTPERPKPFTFNSFQTPRRAGKRQIQGDSNRSARNTAIAEYFTVKKKLIEEKLTNSTIANEKLKLEYEKLKLEYEKLKLEYEKVKPELENNRLETEYYKLENEKLKLEIANLKK